MHTIGEVIEDKSMDVESPRIKYTKHINWKGSVKQSN